MNKIELKSISDFVEAVKLLPQGNEIAYELTYMGTQNLPMIFSSVLADVEFFYSSSEDIETVSYRHGHLEIKSSNNSKFILLLINKRFYFLFS